jgi:hypothetical protein
MGVSVPVASGGCGATHTRPVREGAPARDWKLDCPPCERFLRGADRPQVLKITPGDIKAGIAPRHNRVPDADPQWSSSLQTIPLTPDEQQVNAVRTEKATQQLQMMQALAAYRAAGVEVPPDAMWLLEQTFDQRIIKGTTVCMNGHDSPAGVKFCAECGASMDTRAALETSKPPEAIDVHRLHVQTLRKMLRDKGLPDRGSREDMVRRLQDAA